MLCPYREAFCDAIPLKDVCPELSQLQKESAIVDLNLKTQKGLILKVHRVIFAARLPKLKDFICTSTNSTIDWSRFPQRSVEALTAYVYTGRLEVSTRTAQSIYLLATSLKLEHVRRWCGQFILQRELLQSIKSSKNAEKGTAVRLNQPCLKRSRKCLLLVGEYSPDDVQWSVQTVQPTSGSQHPLAVMKQRDVSQMVALNGLAYVIGGQVNHKLSTSVVEFNPMTGRWRRVASSLLARWGHATAGFGCGIVSCGGVSDSASVVFAELFLPAKNRWFRLPDLLNARAAHRAVAHEEDGRIFVTGGEDEQGLALDLVEYCTLPNFITTGQAESHSFITWRRAAPMNQERKCHALAYVKGKIVAVGGYIGHQEVTRTVEVFSPPDHANPSGQWTFVRSLDLGYNYPFAAAADDYLFVFPGSASQDFQNNPQKALLSDLLQTTDQDHRIWTDLGTLTTVRDVNGVVTLPSLFHSHPV